MDSIRRKCKLLTQLDWLQGSQFLNSHKCYNRSQGPLGHHTKPQVFFRNQTTQTYPRLTGATNRSVKNPLYLKMVPPKSNKFHSNLK